MRSIVVGTAGHIDHGKTTLVRALTGVDADRLAEEQRRGITIDLGFADLELEGVRVGFVDVPGHERFVRNMLAGAHGIDAVALVIAADESVMPQTREHFEICRLLSVPNGLVVITKKDMVDDELLELVQAETEDLVKGSFLTGAPVVAVSARTGEGLDQLKQALVDVAGRLPQRPLEMVARLPVDRAFTMRGFGAVVTGTLISGEINVGEEMDLLPGEHRVRVRGLQVHGETVSHARAGQRTAVNLSGVEARQIERGMVLAPAGRLQPTQILDVQLEALASASRPLRSRARVRVHLGAAEVLGRLRVLEGNGEIAPGNAGFAQLRLERPVIAVPGERFIIRSYSPSHTVGGGRVLDAFAQKHRGREMAKTRSRLAALGEQRSPGQAALIVEAAGGRGMSFVELAARTGWTDRALTEATAEAVARGELASAENVFVARASFDALREAALAEIHEHHRREPLSRGIARETLRERHFGFAPPEVFRAVMASLEAEGAIISNNEVVHAAGHRITLSGTDADLRQQLEKVYKESALEIPSFDEALARTGHKATREHARRVLQLLIDDGALVNVRDDLFLHRDALANLIAKLRAFAAEHEPRRLIDVAGFKDLAGVSRKYAIPLLEYLDREHVTRRAGDQRMIT